MNRKERVMIIREITCQKSQLIRSLWKKILYMSVSQILVVHLIFTYLSLVHLNATSLLIYHLSDTSLVVFYLHFTSNLIFYIKFTSHLMFYLSFTKLQHLRQIICLLNRSTIVFGIKWSYGLDGSS